jgi:HK97 family phage portal protein
MRLFKRIQAWTKAFVPLRHSLGTWWPMVGDWMTGAWQRNLDRRAETILTHSAVYACVSLIASDVSKMHCRLVAEDADGIWEEAQSPAGSAFWPVLRKPNHYQNRIKFFQWWITSKLIHGNTYVLKVRDQRQVVRALYILDPTKVRVLEAPDGSVFYALSPDELSQVPDSRIVPAREIIHDIMVPLYHPLAGVSPLTACGLAALQGLKIQENSTNFFANGSKPGGVITAPTPIRQEVADRIKQYWDTAFSGENAGKVAVLGDGLTYEGMTVNARDAQLIQQLNWSAVDIARCFHVPAHKIDAAPPPNFNNIQALNQQYYDQCLQILIEELEEALDLGLELPKPFGTEFDLDDLLRMDTATLIASEKEAAGIKSPNESRKRLNLKPVPGGETPYLQEQNWPLRLLSARALPPERPPTPPAAVPIDAAKAWPAEPELLDAALVQAMFRKELGMAA